MSLQKIVDSDCAYVSLLDWVWGDRPHFSPHYGHVRSDVVATRERIDRPISEGAEVIITCGDQIENGLRGDAAFVCRPLARYGVSRTPTNRIRERLAALLQNIAPCDILFYRKRKNALEFVLSVQAKGRLLAIRNAIVREPRFLAEVGIDPRDVTVDGDVIRVVAYPDIVPRHDRHRIFPPFHH